MTDPGSILYKIPSVNDLDQFFKNLIVLYNELTRCVDRSVTSFDNATSIKNDIERVLQNLYRGESVRRLEYDIKCTWEENDQKASRVI